MQKCCERSIECRQCDSSMEWHVSRLRVFARLIRKFLPKRILSMQWLQRCWKKLRRRGDLYYINRVRKQYLSQFPVIASKDKIRVGYLVSYDSVFPAEPLLCLMIKDEQFSPIIIITPDPSRGEENQWIQYEKACNHYKNKYGDVCKVIGSYEFAEKRFIDIVNLLDMFCPTFPYPYMTNRLYSTEYLSERGVVPFFIWYSFMTQNVAVTCSFIAISLFWKVFIETPSHMIDYQRYSHLCGANAVVTGYFKLDGFSGIERIHRERKKIIIAPHHTILLKAGARSSFLEYAEFLLKLPSLYPNIDWVFRPHQLLYPRLCQADAWGKDRTDMYFEAMRSYPNVTVQMGGDYFETFVNSDGIIHDCGSFLAEYLVTGHPACFISQREEDYAIKYYNLIGQKCVNAHYVAMSEQDVIAFIDNVVLRNDDPKKDERAKLLKDEILINHPHAARAALHEIKKGLGLVNE